MKNNRIGEVLKQYRKQNSMSVTDVMVQLRDRYELSVAEKTIYGWESNQAHPTADTFVALCELYKIRNLADTFSESAAKRTAKPKDFLISAEELSLIQQYRKYPELQDAVKRVLNMESGFKKPEEETTQGENAAQAPKQNKV